MEETKEQRTKKITDRRVNQILKMFKLFGNLTHPRYHLTEEQTVQVFEVLDKEYEHLKSKFKYPENKFNLM